MAGSNGWELTGIQRQPAQSRGVARHEPRGLLTSVLRPVRSVVQVVAGQQFRDFPLQKGREGTSQPLSATLERLLGSKNGGNAVLPLGGGQSQRFE